MVGLLVLYLINFVIGRSQNTEIAQQWLEAVKVNPKSQTINPQP